MAGFFLAPVAAPSALAPFLRLPFFLLPLRLACPAALCDGAGRFLASSASVGAICGWGVGCGWIEGLSHSVKETYIRFARRLLSFILFVVFILLLLFTIQYENMYGLKTPN